MTIQNYFEKIIFYNLEIDPIITLNFLLFIIFIFITAILLKKNIILSHILAYFTLFLLSFLLSFLSLFGSVLFSIIIVYKHKYFLNLDVLKKALKEKFSLMGWDWK